MLTYSLSTSRAQLSISLLTEQATDRRYKLRITNISSSSNQDTYDIKPNTPITVPLKYGSGQYQTTLYEQVYGNRYACRWSRIFNVTLDDPDACFLYPNVYVDYGKEVEDLAKEICDGKSGRDAYDAVLDYVKTHFRYDFIKAIQIKKNALPDIQGAMKSRSGICQDLSALTVGLLRSVGIKSKLVIGYADKTYHAWVESSVDGRTRRFDPTVAVRGAARPKTYTAERCY